MFSRPFLPRSLALLLSSALLLASPGTAPQLIAGRTIKPRKNSVPNFKRSRFGAYQETLKSLAWYVPKPGSRWVPGLILRAGGQSYRFHTSGRTVTHLLPASVQKEDALITLGQTEGAASAPETSDPPGLLEQVTLIAARQEPLMQQLALADGTALQQIHRDISRPFEDPSVGEKPTIRLSPSGGFALPALPPILAAISLGVASIPTPLLGANIPSLAGLFAEEVLLLSGGTLWTAIAVFVASLFTGAQGAPTTKSKRIAYAFAASLLIALPLQAILGLRFPALWITPQVAAAGILSFLSTYLAFRIIDRRDTAYKFFYSLGTAFLLGALSWYAIATALHLGPLEAFSYLHWLGIQWTPGKILAALAASAVGFPLLASRETRGKTLLILIALGALAVLILPMADTPLTFFLKVLALLTLIGIGFVGNGQQPAL